MQCTLQCQSKPRPLYYHFLTTNGPINFVHAAITLAYFTGLAVAASFGSTFTNLRARADMEADNAHVEATLSDEACPDNCYISDILEQCIANGWNDGTWSRE
ncbi:hypothetical protein C8R45DRAFT_1113848 [Mycena sanguinolenta]|nr:hypothetical protein C8R45DRAFT_1113848 [Mycena sanguinolenta]